MSASQEIWKAIPGYEGFYEVSNFGRARAMDRTIKVTGRQKEKFQKGKLLRLSGNPYLILNVQAGGKRFSGSIHKIVALLFVPNSEKKPFINHKNGNKKDNHHSNLKWCTASENMCHARRILKRPVHNVTPIVGLRGGKEIYFPSMSAANKMGFWHQAISRCIRGEQKTHLGHVWRAA